MSDPAIRIALETRLGTLSPSISTAYQNRAFAKPDLTTPWQAAFLLPARTRNTTLPLAPGQTVELHSGILQVSLNYPADYGSGAAEARAKLLKNHFYAGLNLISGAVKVVISGTAYVGVGQPVDGYYQLVVTIPYFSHIFT